MKNYILFSFIILSIVHFPFLGKKKVQTSPERILHTKTINNTVKDKLFANILNAGNPFITNYNLDLDVNDQIWVIQQDRDGVMLFGSKKGVIVFDGREWSLVRMSAVPLVMTRLENTGKILVGCDNDYGFLEKDKKGLYKYVSLSSKELHPGDITDIEVTNDAVYFYSENALIQLEKSNLVYQSSWYAEKEEIYDGIVRYKNQIYIKVKGKGIYKTQISHKKKLVKKTDVLSTERILFNFPFSDNSTIIGTDSNRLFLFNGKNLQRYNIGFEKYLSENQLVDGDELTDSLFVLSTISGGAIIVNKISGNAKYTVNYQTGLPDDEIFAIGKDQTGALWLSHGFGISRVNYNLPIRDFKSYPGIEGRLIDMQIFDSTLYVATTQGLFYLDTLTNLKEIDVYIKKRIRIRNQKIQEKYKKPEINPDPDTDPDPIVVDDKKTDKKKSAFERRMERKKARLLKKQKAEDELIEPPVEKKKIPEKLPEKKPGKKQVIYKPKYKTKYVKQKKYYNESLGYVFKKSEGIDFKCRQLVAFDDQLLVASINGLYVIHNNKTDTLLQNIYVNQISPSSNKNMFYIATEQGVVMLRYRNDRWIMNKNINPIGFDDNVLTVIEENSKNLWLASNDMIYKLAIDKNLTGKIIGVYDLPGDVSDNILIRKFQKKLFFLASNQIFQYNKKTDKIERSNQLIPDTLSLSNSIYTQPTISWFKTSNKWVYLSDYYQISEEQLAILNIFDHIKSIKVDIENNLWIIDGKEDLYKILPVSDNNLFSSDFRVFFKEIKDETGQRLSLKKMEFEYKQKSFTFSITAPFYVKQNAIKYQYFVEGAMNDWSEWRPRPDFDLFIAKPGKYVVNVRAKNIFGTISPPQKVVFKIKTPIWMTTWFFITIAGTIVILILIVVVMIVKKRERKLLKEKMLLENKVRERTLEILHQKEEIEQKNKEITDSINYASNIQNAVMPPIDILEKSVSDYFLIHKPRDIVSGDYYWFNRKNGNLIVTVADCTGHGVPGAFLSMLGMSSLREITNKMEDLKASTILDKLREKIIESLHQTGADDERKDGMDMALSVLDLHNMKLQFAGAYNPLFLARGNHIEVVKGDRMPIGIHKKVDVPFVGYEIEVQKGDTFYMFSDGFIDQFGGEHNRKFLSRNFKKLLLEIQGLDMKTQKSIILQTFETWKGNEVQIDDILIIGIRI